METEMIYIGMAMVLIALAGVGFTSEEMIGQPRNRPHRTRSGQTPVSSGMHNPCARWPLCKLCY